MRSPLAVFAALLVATLAACSSGTQTSSTTAPSSEPSRVATPLHVDGATLPPGPELAALQNSCQACHSFGMVTQQRLSAATWKAEITKMRGFGAPLPATQQSSVVAYLARYLSPTVPRSRERTTAEAPPITYTSRPQPKQ
jgi:cytochrome c5